MGIYPGPKNSVKWGPGVIQVRTPKMVFIPNTFWKHFDLLHKPLTMLIQEELQVLWLDDLIFPRDFELI